VVRARRAGVPVGNRRHPIGFRRSRRPIVDVRSLRVERITVSPIARLRRPTGPRLAAGMVAAGLCLVGCSFASPVQVNSQANAGAGSDADLTAAGGAVHLRGFAVVTSAKGSPGVVVGLIANDGGQPVRVTLKTDPGSDTDTAPAIPVIVPADGSTVLGGGTGTTAELAHTAAPPGASILMTAQLDSGDNVQWQVPVMAPVGPYASVSPAAS
jgi:hypothetical protein